MTTSDHLLSAIQPAGTMLVPVLVAAAGERAARRFLDFFAANFRNPNTRAAYGVAAEFLRLARPARHQRARRDPHAHHVLTHIESLTREYRAPTV